MLMKVMGLSDRSEIILKEEIELTAAQLSELEKLLKRKEMGEPMAYILGKKEFYGLEFLVDERVLIPRPETEVLVERIIELAPSFVLEVGVGSGCIILTLAKNLEKGVRLVGIERAAEALAVARLNAKKLGVEERAELVQGDLVSGREEIVRAADVVVANLPYVDQNWNWLGEELKYEPRTALFAREGGLELIFRLIKMLKMKAGAKLILEADESQHLEIIKFAEKYGYKLVLKRGLMIELKFG